MYTFSKLRHGERETDRQMDTERGRQRDTERGGGEGEKRWSDYTNRMTEIYRKTTNHH